MTGPALLESQRVRQDIRAGRITGTSRGLAHGFVQTNLAILPKQYAFDFLLYCQRNQRACPVLEVTDPGSPVPTKLAPTADLRTDCARYAIYRDGVRTEDRTDITDLWRDDLVTFLIGSGISIDGALENAGVPTHKDRWVLRTTLPTEPAGPFHGDMIVTMRWLTAAAGDHRDTGDLAVSVQSRRADPSRRSIDHRRRPCGPTVRRPGAGHAARHRAGVLGLRRHPAKRRRERQAAVLHRARAGA